MVFGLFYCVKYFTALKCLVERSFVERQSIHFRNKIVAPDSTDIEQSAHFHDKNPTLPC